MTVPSTEAARQALERRVAWLLDHPRNIRQSDRDEVRDGFAALRKRPSDAALVEALVEARSYVHGVEAESSLSEWRKATAEGVLGRIDAALATALRGRPSDAALVEALARAARVAENLHGMVPREVWRDHGADDGQGHYEGDYRAIQIQGEILGWKELVAALAPAEGETT